MVQVADKQQTKMKDEAFHCCLLLVVGGDFKIILVPKVSNSISIED
jgi:hypothetical protein